MPRIVYFMAASSFTDEECDRRATMMRDLVPPGFDVSVWAKASGLATLDPPDYAERVVADTAREIARFGPSDADAIVLGVALDLGLAVARERARVPVVGPGEASLHVAALVGRPLSIIAVDRMTAGVAETMLATTLVKPPIVSVRSMDTPLDVVVTDPGAARRALRRECAAARSEGAEGVYLGAMTLSTHAWAPAIPRELGLRVFDPLPIALATAVQCTRSA
jgi:allantoin racemase